MTVLRSLLTGWPAVFSLLVSPTVAVFLEPGAAGMWKQWLCVLPFVLAYVWFTWPRRPAEVE
jgi:hypothetical protein